MPGDWLTIELEVGACNDQVHEVDDHDDPNDGEDEDESGVAESDDCEGDYDFNDEDHICLDCEASPTLRCPYCGRLTQLALTTEGALEFEGVDDENEYDF